MFARGEAGDQVVELEHEADVVAPVFGQPAIVELAALLGRAAAGNVQSAEDIEQGRLATPRRTQEHQYFARVDIQVDLAQCLHGYLVHTIALADVTGAQHNF